MADFFLQLLHDPKFSRARQECVLLRTLQSRELLVFLSFLEINHLNTTRTYSFVFLCGESTWLLITASKGGKKKKEKKKRKKGICRWLSFSFYRDIFPCLRCPSQIYIFFFKLETSKISVYLWNLKYLCNFSHVVEAPTLSHSSHLPHTQEFNTYNLVTCMPLESNAYSSPLPNTSRRQIFVLWFWLFSSLPNICICATYTDILRQTKWIPV